MEKTERGEVVRLNVGGVRYSTSIPTLIKIPNSFFSAMFGGSFPLQLQDEVFIDRDGDLFKYILNYLRRGRVILPQDSILRQELIEEAQFYSLSDLVQALQGNLLVTPEFNMDMNCICFDGVDDYIDLGLYQTHPLYTIELWIKVLDLQGDHCGIFFCGGKTGWGLVFLNQKLCSRNTLTAIGTDGLVDDFDLEICVEDLDQTWAHIAVVNSNTERRFYFNGDLFETKAHASVGQGILQSNLVGSLGCRGRDRENPGSYFRGCMRDVRIWGVVRSAGAISKNRFNLDPKDSVGLLNHWMMDEGVGYCINDIAGDMTLHLAPGKAKAEWRSFDSKELYEGIDLEEGITGHNAM